MAIPAPFSTLELIFVFTRRGDGADLSPDAAAGI
jgi:hypothetical protein